MSRLPPLKTDPELLELIESSKIAYAKLSESEKEAMMNAQRESWVRGNIGFEWDDETLKKNEHLFGSVTKNGG